LARCFPGIDRILKSDEPYPEFDFYVHLMSLPRVFGTELASVPAAIPYLRAESARRARWADRLGAASAFRVGLFWAGDANHLRDRHRSVALSALAPLAEVEGAQFYSLQVGGAALQLANPPAGMRITDLGSELEDFADTAAVIDQMDLVISVDTSVAHLAGALGKPVWMLVGLPAEWRWMTEREDTPWYPTMRLFRQRRHGDWSEVIARVRDALRARVRSRPPQEGSPSINRLDAAPTPLVPAPEEGYSFAGRSAPAETAMGIVQYFPDQPIVGDSIGWYGEYLRAQTDLLASLMKPGNVVMEVGAGIGAHVLALAPTIGRTGHFFVYEPRPLFQQVLRQNLGANGIGNVTVMKRSLRGQESRAADEDEVPLSHDSGDPAIATETVDELRLDALHWLKINEETDALQVLTGASETLWRLRPKLFVAVPDEGVRDVETRLRDHGYQCWKVTTAYFNPKNFNRRDADIFPGRATIAVVAIPEEIEATLACDGCERL
jgi:FkbM family methyltransferase